MTKVLRLADVAELAGVTPRNLFLWRARFGQTSEGLDPEASGSAIGQMGRPVLFGEGTALQIFIASKLSAVGMPVDAALLSGLAIVNRRLDDLRIGAAGKLEPATPARRRGELWRDGAAFFAWSDGGRAVIHAPEGARVEPAELARATASRDGGVNLLALTPIWTATRAMLAERGLG